MIGKRLPGPLLLQRRLAPGDGAKWRTVLRFAGSSAVLVESLVSLAGRIDPSVQWRVATLEGPVHADR